MAEAVPSGSYLAICDEKTENVCPMYFSVSCAFFALRLLTCPVKEEEKWCEQHEKMLGIQLLSLLAWRNQRGASKEKFQLIEKLKNAKKQIEELKKLRHEDAKANEKVVGIFASQEQNWLNERKRLRLQIGALMSELRVMEKIKNESLSELNETLKEMELLVLSKDKVLEEMEQKQKALEESLEKSEKALHELRETAAKEAQEHSCQLWKQKTAFIELVSNQRPLEAELGRVLKQIESKKEELKIVLEQKEESVLLAEKLSLDLIKMRKDLEQKDNMLSVVLRKSKLDTIEKQSFFNHVKVSKSKRKQAGLDTKKRRVVSESRNSRQSLRGMFVREVKSKDANKSRFHMVKPAIEYEYHDLHKDPEVVPDINDPYSPQENEELGTTSWIRWKPEKHAIATEKKHNVEMDAFAEQMRLKDEKVEGLYLRLLSMELESKWLHSYIEGLKHDISQLRHNNMKLEAILLQREEQNSLRKQFSSQLKRLTGQKFNSSSSSRVKASKREPAQDQVVEKHSKEVSREKDCNTEEETPSPDESKAENVVALSAEKDIEEEKAEEAAAGCNGQEYVNIVEIDSTEKSTSAIQTSSKANNSVWRMDLQALGVNYKIERLKQQLSMLERFSGKQENGDTWGKGDDGAKNPFMLLMSLLHKQVNRYQSLQGKTDDLCKRMHENNLDIKCGELKAAKKKVVNKTTLEQFLEETFQLQRYIVATGQKLIEIQTKIASGFIAILQEVSDLSSGFDMKRFAESIRSLFQEVQRGLEVRISRIIGGLEGTLACESMVHIIKR